MDILIKAGVADLQAFALYKALERRGHRVVLDRQCHFPASEARSMRFGRDGASPLQVVDADGRTVFDRAFDVVLVTGAAVPAFAPEMAEADRAFVEDEVGMFLKSQGHFVGDDKTFWVNPPLSYRRSGLKPVQLEVAHKVGFTIPETLISNNADHILDFCQAQGGEIVLKPFELHTWREDGSYIIPTTRVTEADIRGGMAALGLCPAIFQALIRKRFELRITIFGETVIAAQLDAQHIEKAQIDWRRAGADAAALDISRCSLPADIEAKCLAMMKDLGLVYGCIDMIVDEDGDYYFLEINNAGKFLWKEAYGTGLPMLHVFCDFIESRDPAFQWDGREHYSVGAMTEDPVFQSEMHALYGTSAAA